MIRFEGYNPLSSTLRYSEVHGTCMGVEWERAIAWFDESLPVRSGDLVRVGLRDRAGRIVYVVKRLEVDRAGFWYLVASAHGVTPLMLLTGSVVSFARIVGRAERENDYMSAPDMSDIEADARDLELQELFSRAAREEWAREGYVTGVTFPGMDGVQARGYPPQAPFAEASAATIPPTNPTAPTVPQNVVIRAINGTLEFSWDTPVVKPKDTRYQIWSAVNCSDATAGTLRWEGDALRTTLSFIQADINSGSFYWMRAGANSYFSAWSPTTYGTPASFTPPAESRTVISDPQFRQGQSIGSYWIPIGGLPVSLSPTGGPSDGTGKLIVVGTTAWGGSPWTRDVYCARTGDNDPQAPCQPGQWFNWSVLVRRTSAITSGGGFTLSALNRYIVSGANVDLNVTAPLVRCDTITLNTWTAIVGSLQISAADRYNLVYLNLRFDYSNMGSGTLEISGVDAILR